MSDPQPVYLSDYQPPAYRVTHTELTFDLDPAATRVKARLLMERHPEADTNAPLVLNGEHLKLISLAIDEVTLEASAYALDDEGLRIAQVPERFVLESEVEIAPQENTALEGLYQSNAMYCTQCEAEGFRRITFYPDRPDVMATFNVTVIGDQQREPILLANGNPIGRGELDGGRHFVTWEDPHPKPCYLFALVAGNLHSVEDHFTTMSGRVVTLQIWVEKENLDKTDHAMASLKRAMEWDEQAYGREYDLDLFMIVAVSDFNMGAMENKGLNIFNSAAVLTHPHTATDAAFQSVEGIVAHEYFHNWSGNRVTCRDWFQLSLKEGFTVFRDQCFSADTNSAPVKRIQDVSFFRTAQFAEDAGPTAHPIRPDHYIEITNFYTLTIYEKGAEVVRMLRNLVGEEAFRRGSDRYFERFDGQAVTIEDFVGCMAEVSGEDFSQFMRWYSQAGTPDIDAHGEYDYVHGEYHLTLRQRTPATPGQTDKLPLHIPVRMGLVGTKSGQDLTLTLNGEKIGKDAVIHLREDEQTFVFTDVAEAPVPSLLREFSAPVKMHYPYSREDLAFLLTHDSDGFNRWDAGQRLALLALEDLIAAHRNGVEKVMDSRVVDAFKALLNGPMNDKAVLAEMLTLPSEAYIAEQQPIVDVDAIHAAREFVRQSLAMALRDEFAAIYEANMSEEAYAPTPEQIAQRSLKNVALAYLMSIEDEQGLAWCEAQFAADHNMTDVRQALTQLVHSDRDDLASPALKAFGEKWAHDPLVMDQWFTVQVSRPQSDVLERVKYLMQHPAFSLKNPNRVRALIGAFAQNRVNFHRLDGQGYQLLADVVIELNRLNPEIAARLITPLTRWQRFDETRQALMRSELERIKQQPLSANVYEVVEKALA
ncbi:aminopeptidase N [Halomonas sp. ISL-60]|uniref:aminopeptidase N n=1 Tax=unclassified Halomonas TaxID=2609666 RepID=UPI0007D904A2|nr:MULTISPECIES: aminopeptidase N [unclassified Halomonas]MBT2775091.1 aminopeptidase N [Halomonas sp. ISL-60]MBT2787450.1 aminopeptidase N [Halomonas sp. ISL-106]MBT2796188.1 aminopeptidase N [Halomonas sp. ISL-104]MBT2802472.1 aminopeptidase N [Halomonas sp. ISL-56]OAL57655.1 aminopeptidase N [Halomonas sp. ALS9]